MDIMDNAEYKRACQEAKSLGIRYEYQPYDYLIAQIEEKKKHIAQRGRSCRTYVDNDVRGENVLELDYKELGVKSDVYRDIDQMSVGDRVVVNPKLTAQCAGIDLLLLRDEILANNGILTIERLDILEHIVTVKGMYDSFHLPAVVVERSRSTTEPVKKKKLDYTKQSPTRGVRDHSGQKSELVLTEEQTAIMNNDSLSKSEKIRKLYRTEAISVADIARAVEVHYSHAYCVVSEYRKILKDN